MLTGVPSKSRSLNTTAVALLGVILFSASAAKANAPSVGLRLPNTGEAGMPTSFSYTSAHVPRSAKLVVQRQEGTARVWRTVLSITGKQGTGALPPLEIGTYAVRLAVLSRHQLVASKRVRITMFGKVPLAALLGNKYATGSVAHEGTFAGRSQTFTYVVGLGQHSIKRNGGRQGQ